jgi:hypothetical protein
MTAAPKAITPLKMHAAMNTRIVFLLFSQLIGALPTGRATLADQRQR